MGGLCFGWSQAKCKSKVNISSKNKNTLYKFVEQQDEAAAVGDPHMSMSDGSQQDMCCDNGPCRACDLSQVEALVQEDTSAVAITKIHTQRRCPGNGVKRSKSASAQECADSFAGLGVKYMAFWSMNNDKYKAVRGICIGWNGIQCDTARAYKVKQGVKTKMFSYSEEEEVAEAVGDPHMTVSNGAKEDLCCEGGHCHPCQ